MSDGMVREKRCGIATTAEHLRHPDLILLVNDDGDMSALSRVWWRISQSLDVEVRGYAQD